MTNNAPEKLLLSAREAARMLSICEKTLWTRTAPRGQIPALKIGSRVLYSLDGLRAWIDAQTAIVGGVDNG
jgi:hypothetical protein